MAEDRITNKDKINNAREEKKIKALTEAKDANFNKRIWAIAAAASAFMLVSSLSLGFGIALGTGNLPGGGNQTVSASGGNDDGNSTTPPVSQEPGSPATTVVKGEQTIPVNAATDGFIFTSIGKVISSDAVDTPESAIDNPGKVDMKIYLDYSCSYCKLFEEAESANIAEALSNPNINVSYHLLAFLGEYSKAAGNASVCVASLEPAKWDEVSAKLFEGSGGGANVSSLEEAGGYVANLLDPVGLGEKTYSCINDLRHVDWLEAATSRAFSTPQTSNGDIVDGTPTVIADSDLYSGQGFAEVGGFVGIVSKHLGLIGK
jgi:hypothetical protein